jgi:periplasmic protein TonB
VTAGRHCPGCLLAAVFISAAAHLAVAAALMWSAAGARAPDSGPDEVGVTLAMFAATAPAHTGNTAPLPTDPVTASGAAADDAVEAPPEASAATLEPPLPEPAVAPVAPQTPPPSAPKPAPKPKPMPRPQQAKRLAKVERGPAPVQPVSPRTAAASQGADSGAPAAAGGGKAADGADAKALESEYLKGLQQAITRNRFYPPAARREDVKGVVTVAFTVQGDGRIGEVRVAKGSGFETLDGAAVETLRRLGTYRPIPDGIGRSRWSVRVPIVFDLR